MPPLRGLYLSQDPFADWVGRIRRDVDAQILSTNLDNKVGGQQGLESVVDQLGRQGGLGGQ